MSIRMIVVVVVVVVAFLAGIAWQSQMQKQPAQQQAPQASGESAMPGGDASGMPPGMPPGGGTMGGQVAAPPADANPGVAWHVPANWNTLEPKPMRVATYGIPAQGGDTEGAECAVYYFGPSQGGGVQENIDRWVGQFEHPSQPQRSQAQVAGFNVYRVHVTGAYLAPSGPMMQSTGTKAGYALSGAIVEGPNGRVFFKLTGPEKTVKACAKEFEDLLKSMHKS